MNSERVVVDVNIAFRCLGAGRGDLRARLFQRRDIRMYAPGYLFVELFKHKERLVRASRWAKPDILDGLYTLTSQMRFYNESLIPVGTWAEALRLCRDIDEKDTPYVALALHSGAVLWTEDEVLNPACVAKGSRCFGFVRKAEIEDVPL